MNSEILSDIRLRAQKTNLHDLEKIARVIGVSKPTGNKKEALIEEIIKIASCEISPGPRTARGAPPKSTDYNMEFVKEIEECIKIYSAIKNGTGEVSDRLEVSDGTSESICSGILIKEDKYYFLRANGCFPSAEDIYVHESYVNRFALEEGDKIEGIKISKSAREAPALISVISVNGYQPDGVRRIPFENLTPIYPKNRILISNSGKEILTRIIDLFAPLGLGQRGVICGPVNSGKTSVLKQIALGIRRNRPDLILVVLLNGARPEDVTCLKRELNGTEIFYTLFADEGEKIVKAAKFASLYCKRQTECGKNVVLLADGLSQLERASREIGASGAAKRLLSSAVCAEEGCSLTVIATVNHEDEVAGGLLQAANMRVNLYNNSFFRFNFPAIDVLNTSTYRYELLQSDREIKAADELRVRLNKYGNSAESMNEIIKLFEDTKNNEQLIKEISNG